MTLIVSGLALAGLLCSAISIAYAHSQDARSKRLAGLWLRRMGVCAALGLLLVYLGGAR